MTISNKYGKEGSENEHKIANTKSNSISSGNIRSRDINYHKEHLQKAASLRTMVLHQIITDIMDEKDSK